MIIQILKNNKGALILYAIILIFTLILINNVKKENLNRSMNTSLEQIVINTNNISNK